MTTTMQPMDDEIDLRELGAALKRRWRWLLGCTLSGLAIGGVVALKQPAQVELSMFIDLSKGPQSPASASLDKSDSLGPLLVTNYQPKYQQQTAILLLRSLLVSSGKATPEQLRLIEIAQPTDKALKSDQLLEVTATVPSAQAPNYQALFEALGQDLLRQIEKTLLPADAPAQSGFVQRQSLEKVKDLSGRALALGGLAGLVVGAGAGLLADRRANRVFSSAQLQQLLGYPVLAILPVQPWVDPVAQAELCQLGQQLDPRLHWMVLSIANQHSFVEPLASALKLQPAPPLLSHTLKAFSASQPGGVLLVVEPGFNSALARPEARRTLELLPRLEQVGLVLIEKRALPELVG